MVLNIAPVNTCMQLAHTWLMATHTILSTHFVLDYTDPLHIINALTKERSRSVYENKNDNKTHK